MKNYGINEEAIAIEAGESEKYQESFERASADLEMLCAAYPEEIAVFQPEEKDSGNGNSKNGLLEPVIPSWFPLVFTLTLPDTLPKVEGTEIASSQTRRCGANITMEFPMGYPAKSLQIISYRSSSSIKKEFIEQAANAVRTTASEAIELYHGEECGLACCAAAINTWNECLEQEQIELSNAQCIMEAEELKRVAHADDDNDIHWISAENTLVDRRSVFQAHVCVVSSDDMVRRAVRKLIQSSNKIQRATHNMYAYRFIEILEDGKHILKHDNDDDGEDGAGKRLAQLLEMRKENGVLIMVSRWYGGVHLGPKRFAHITNVARDFLIEWHEKQMLA